MGHVAAVSQAYRCTTTLPSRAAEGAGTASQGEAAPRTRSGQGRGRKADGGGSGWRRPVGEGKATSQITAEIWEAARYRARVGCWHPTILTVDRAGLEHWAPQSQPTKGISVSSPISVQNVPSSVSLRKRPKRKAGLTSRLLTSLRHTAREARARPGPTIRIHRGGPTRPARPPRVPCGTAYPRLSLALPASSEGQGVAAPRGEIDTSPAERAKVAVVGASGALSPGARATGVAVAPASHSGRQSSVTGRRPRSVAAGSGCSGNRPVGAEWMAHLLKGHRPGRLRV